MSFLAVCARCGLNFCSHHKNIFTQKEPEEKRSDDNHILFSSLERAAEKVIEGALLSVCGEVKTYVRRYCHL
jgi:hypothetical protein